MTSNQWLIVGAVAVVAIVLIAWQPWKKKADVKKTHVPAIERIVTV